MVHAALAQTPVAWAGEQTTPHPPQLALSLSITVHAPPQQAPGLPTHRVPQAPQLPGSVWVLTHADPQHTEPTPQACADVHPVVHTPEAQTVPGAQSESVMQPTHAWRLGLQWVRLPQSASVVQPWVHAYDAASQYCPAGHVSLLGEHKTQRPEAMSHTGPESALAQSALDWHPEDPSVADASVGAGPSLGSPALSGVPSVASGTSLGKPWAQP